MAVTHSVLNDIAERQHEAVQMHMVNTDVAASVKTKSELTVGTQSSKHQLTNLAGSLMS